MKRKAKIGAVLSFASVLAFVPAPALASVEKLSISTAMQVALQNNPDVRNAREKLNEDHADLRVAVAQLFPAISASVAATTKQDSVTNGSPLFSGTAYNLYSINGTATQILFDGLVSINGLAYYKKQIEVNRYDEVVAEYTLGLSVIEAFYTTLLNQRILDDYLKTKKIDEEVLGVAQHRYRIGREQLLDVLQIKTQLAQLEPQIEQASTNIQNSAAQLVALLGDPHISEIEVQGKLKQPPWEPLVSKQKSAPAIRPELAQNRLLQDQFGNKRMMTLGTSYPQLSAVGTLSQSAYDKSELFTNAGLAWSVGLQLSIPLFSGLSYWHTRSMLASQEVQLRITEEKLLDQENSEQVQAKKNLELAAQQIESSQLAASLAEQSLVEAQRTFKLATIDYIQFLQTQTALFQAHITYDQAKYSLIDALAKYFVAYGYPLQDLVTWLANASGGG